MAITITCDRCGEEIDGDFVIVKSSFYSDGQEDPIEFCAPGDEFCLCDICYQKILEEVMQHDSE